MELAQQCVSSLQGIAEVDRVAPSIRVRGRSATAVGTHDVDFAHSQAQGPRRGALAQFPRTKSTARESASFTSLDQQIVRPHAG